MEKVVLKSTDGNIYIGQLCYSMSNTGDIPMKVEQVKPARNTQLNEKFYDYIKRGEYAVECQEIVTFYKPNVVWSYTVKID